MKINWKKFAAAGLMVAGMLLTNGCGNRSSHDHHAHHGSGYYHYPHRVSHASHGSHHGGHHGSHHKTHYAGCGHKSVSYHYY